MKSGIDTAEIRLVEELFIAAEKCTSLGRLYVFETFKIPKELQVRLFWRDQVVREIWNGYFSDLNDNQRAKKIEQIFDRYLATRWRFETDLVRLPIAADYFERLLHRLARFNLGRPLCVRQIKNVKDGLRSGS